MVESNGKNSDGFTILEILISMLLLSMLVLITLDIVVYSTQANELSRSYSLANSIAYEKIQEYELKDFDDIDNGVSSGGYIIEDFSDEAEQAGEGILSNVQATVASQPVSGSLKKLLIRIEYVHSGVSRYIEYADYIQIGGVGR